MELKRLEQGERQFKKDRDELLRTLLGVESGLADIRVDDDSALSGLMSTEPKKRKKGGHYVEDSPMVATPSVSSGVAPVPPKKPQSAKAIAYGHIFLFLHRSLLTPILDLTHCITRTDVAPSTSTVTKAAHQPVSLRSFKLPAPKMAIAAKVTQLLTEQGINHARLVMPTRDNCAQLEVLIEAATGLLETKKVVDRVEQDIRVLKARLISKEGSLGAEENAMDVDQETSGEGEAVDGRSQSVLSTRSGRGRKNVSSLPRYLFHILILLQNRRSMSISSVDTNAVLSTRSTKRQKHG